MVDDARALQSEWFELRKLLQPVVRRRQFWETTERLQSRLVKEGRPLPSAGRSELENITKPVSFEEMLAQAWPSVQRSKLDPSRYKRLVRSFYRTWEQQRKPTKSLENLIRHRLETVEASLEAIPASIQKCESFLHAMLRHDPQMEMLSYFASRGETLDPGDLGYWINLRNEQRLPSGRLGQEDVIAAIEYEFFDRFDRTPSDSYLRKVAVQLNSSFAQARAQITENRLDGHTVTYRNLLMTLWLCARVPALRQAVAVEARRALSEVVVSQNADGSWHEMNVGRGPLYVNHETVLPSPFVTALAVNTMQAFIPAQFQDQQARAIGWLCQVQLQDGSWADREVDSKGDLWATLAALGSLKGGQSGDLGRYIDAGEAWLLSRQNSLGVYHGVPFTDPFACVLVLEYFARERRAHQPSDRFTQAAIQLMGRANDIVAHDHTDYADRALAIFAIHHAVEFFLYGILQLPSVDINIYANEKETLGLRQALASLRDHLRAIDKLKPAQELSFRTQISDLANDRDSSVHKARDLQQDQLRTHFETAKKFISKYSQMTMGRDILRE